MTTPSSAEFSYNLYPGLDDELQAALERNIANGTAEHAEIATSGLAAAVAETDKWPELAAGWRSSEVRNWAQKEIFIEAVQAWEPYDLLAGTQKEIYENLIDRHIEKLNRLYNARNTLIATAGETFQGNNVGESMHLTLMPWQHFKENLQRLPEWIKEMRTLQGIATNDDDYDLDLINRLQDGTKLYRNPKVLSNHKYPLSAQWMSGDDYLDQKIAEDGPWGLALTQTTDEAGTKELPEMSPDELTNEGRQHLEIGGERVDGLGIFEWLAMTLQHNPAKLSRLNKSWLLANRLEVDGMAQVPCGDWSGTRVRLDMEDASYWVSVRLPRLVVL
jgi:hypothetical protein